MVVDQDRVMLEAMALEARQREMLLTTDIAVVRMRRMMHDEAARQFAALADAGTKAAE